MLLAALLSALVRFDAEAGSATSSWDLTSGAGSFLLVMEQLHQQVELQTAAHSQSVTEQQMAAFHSAGKTDELRNNLKYKAFHLGCTVKSKCD